MTGFDFTVIAILLISMGLGLWRGLVYEILSLLGWPVAFVISKLFAIKIAPFLPITQEIARATAAYVVMFVGALIVWGIVVWLLSKLIKAVGLGWLDSAMGGLFGLLRGMLVVLVLVWLAGVTTLPKEPFWRDAYSSAVFEKVAQITKVWLPESLAQRLQYPVRH